MALGGAAPPVVTETLWSKTCLAESGAFASMFSTTGAPQRWVTPSRLIAA